MPPAKLLLMPVRIGFLGVAHMHAWGYASALAQSKDAECVGFWESDADRAARFKDDNRVHEFELPADLFAACDAVVIASVNVDHAELGVMAADAGKAILCEKPIVISEDQGQQLLDAVSKNSVIFMTAFPCPFSPVFLKLKSRIDAGEIGDIVAINATNRGTCPFDWFVDPDQSGGGAMIDHVVHVADLLWRLLGREPERVTASCGNNMYGKDWEDSALLTLDYGNGVFATLDSSWSRPKSYKTWGDVNLTVVGEQGTIEAQLFSQQIDLYSNNQMSHGVRGYGSDLDALLVDSFVNAIQGKSEPYVTLEDGLRACRVSFAGYSSAQSTMAASLRS